MAHKIPTKGIFSSLRTAISNRYNVKLDDLYNHKSISNDMIAEILENPFLTPNQKEEFCNHILCFKHAEQENSSEALDLSDKTRSNSNLTSIILALCSFTMMLSLSLLLTDNIEKYNSSKQLFWDNTFLFASVTIIPLLLVIIFYYLSRIPAKAIRHRSHINNKI